MRALAIGHDHIGGVGHVGAALARAGWELSTFTVVPGDRFDAPDVHVDFPDVDAYDLLVTLGAPWPRAAIDTWVPSEVELLATAHAEGTPILAICAGAQFLAEALGGGSGPLGRERVGWRSVRPRDDTVPAGPWFQWHSDRITLPPGAEVVADSEDGVEAFRVGASVGVQFHPEMSAALLDRWLEVSPVDDDRAGRLRVAARTHEADAPERADALLRGLRVL